MPSDKYMLVLFMALFIMVSQICRVAPRINIEHSDPSNDRNIKMFQNFKQIFEP
jgi:hypothetical protein